LPVQLDGKKDKVLEKNKEGKKEKEKEEEDGEEEDEGESGSAYDEGDKTQSDESEGEAKKPRKKRKQKSKKKMPQPQSAEAEAEEKKCAAAGSWPVANTVVHEVELVDGFAPGEATPEAVEKVVEGALGVTDEMAVHHNVADIHKSLKNNTFSNVVSNALALVDKSVNSVTSGSFHTPTLVMVNASRLPMRSLRIIHKTVMDKACGDAPEHRLCVAFHGLTWARVTDFIRVVLPEDYTCSPPHVHFDAGANPKPPSYILFVSKTPKSNKGKTEISRRNIGWQRRDHHATSSVAYSSDHVFIGTARTFDGVDLALLDAIRCRTRPDDVVWVINDHKNLFSSAGAAAASLHCRVLAITCLEAQDSSMYKLAAAQALAMSHISLRTVLLQPYTPAAQAATIWLSAVWSVVLQAGNKPAHNLKITWKELFNGQTPPRTTPLVRFPLGRLTTPPDGGEDDEGDVGYCWRHGIETRDLSDYDKEKVEFQSTFVVSAKVCHARKRTHCTPTPPNKLTHSQGADIIERDTILQLYPYHLVHDCGAAKTERALFGRPLRSATGQNVG
jgi:hypothetical protein